MKITLTDAWIATKSWVAIHPVASCLLLALFLLLIMYAAK